MRSCPHCGGIIGRDCFNPVECGWITQQMDAQYAVDDYINKQHAKAEKDHYEKIEREYYEYLEKEYNDSIIERYLLSNSLFTRFLTIS